MNKTSNQKNQKRKSSAKSRRGQSVPAAFPGRARTTPVRMVQRGDNSITVTNEEYICDVVTEVNFTARSFSVNPGLSTTFPWLANVANNYELYTFESLSFEYRTSTGTTSYGTVCMAFDYDAADAAPSSKQRMMSYIGSVADACYKNITVSSNRSLLTKMAKERYVRPGDVPDGKDVKTYDVANLFLASSGGAGNTTGSLYVKYRIRLEVPHTPAEYPWEQSGLVYTAAASKAQPFNGAAVSNAQVVDPVVATRDDSSIYIKKAGEYLGFQSVTGTGLTAPASSTFLTVGSPSAAAAASLQSIFGNLGTGSTTADFVYKIKTLADNSYLTMTPPAGWTTMTANNIRLAPYAYSLI